MDYLQLFSTCKETQLDGRYIHLDHIEPLLEQLAERFAVSVIGRSVEDKPIYRVDAGHGPTKLLLWSQMHGNESTATKALCDLFKLLSDESEIAAKLLGSFTFCIIPILNPDGAQRYTRENAAGVDLNRDFTDLSQPESRALVAARVEFEPNYCYNLHDQRTIFGVDDSGKPATISFLAPAYNQERDWNEPRTQAASVIVNMNEVLQQYIPNCIGRFDDSFNINCAGDSFQASGCPTILIEAGHYPNDYKREETRKYFFIALVSGFYAINENVVVSNKIADYLSIPPNKALFYDFVFKNVRINYDGNEIITNFATQYNEQLRGDRIIFQSVIAVVGSLKGFFGHEVIDVGQDLYQDENDNQPIIGEYANFTLGRVKFINSVPEKKGEKQNKNIL
ncbi:MAG TPA: M14 metallopeptidase family protein [Flavobacterium sp.]